MARYLVRNNRLRRVETVCGRTLAPLQSKGTGEAWLSEAEWSSAATQKRMTQKRIVLVLVDPPLVAPAREFAPKVVEEEITEVVEPGAVASTDVEEVDEPAPVEESPEEEDDSEDSVEDESPVEGDDSEDSAAWTFETLKAASYRSNQKLCKEYGLKSSGTEDSLIGRLLAYQEAYDA